MPMKITLFATIKNQKKSAKNASNGWARKKEGLQGRLSATFDDFGCPQGGPKITKNRKKAFQKSIEQKDAKKEAMIPVRGEGRWSLAQPRESKIPLRKALAKYRKQI